MTAATLLPPESQPSLSSQPENGRLSVSVAGPTPPLRIALIGQAGAGKSTHAAHLRSRYKGDVLSFAGPLKKVTAEIFGERMNDTQFARTANQEVGILARRLAGPTIWVEKLAEKISTNRNCFIDDCRFHSEYIALRARGFIIIKLFANPDTLQERRPSMTREQWEHESERDIMLLHADAYFSTDMASELETHNDILAWLGSDDGKAARQRAWNERTI